VFFTAVVPLDAVGLHVDFDVPVLLLLAIAVAAAVVAVRGEAGRAPHAGLLPAKRSRSAQEKKETLFFTESVFLSFFSIKFNNVKVAARLSRQSEAPLQLLTSSESSHLTSFMRSSKAGEPYVSIHQFAPDFSRDVLEEKILTISPLLIHERRVKRYVCMLGVLRKGHSLTHAHSFDLSLGSARFLSRDVSSSYRQKKTYQKKRETLSGLASNYGMTQAWKVEKR